MIRFATRADLDAIYVLIKQLSRHDFTKEQFESCFQYNLNNSHILVCEHNNRIRGCGVLCVHYSLHFSRKSAEIVELIVDENFRSNGMGKELMAALEQIAVDSGCVSIEVDSGKRRENAHRFYEREGFVSTHCKLTKELSL
jgi:PhnO protein